MTFQFCRHFTFGYISVLAKFQNWCLAKLCFFVKIIVLPKFIFCKKLHFAKIRLLTKLALGQIWRFRNYKNLCVVKVFTLPHFLLCKNLHIAKISVFSKCHFTNTTLQFWEHFSFGDISVLVTFLFW